jgi:hypothetical protein
MPLNDKKQSRKNFSGIYQVETAALTNKHDTKKSPHTNREILRGLIFSLVFN